MQPEYVEIGDYDVLVEVVRPWTGIAACPVDECRNHAVPLLANAQTKEDARAAIIEKVRKHLEDEHGLPPAPEE